ncbi:DUF4998 domain-containing protein [Wenyingzhuangia sp. IMCC45467]
MASMLITATSCNFDELPDPPNNNDNTLRNLNFLEIVPGQNKVSVKGVVDDPNVTEVKIYWNNDADVVSIPLDSPTKEDTIRTEINNLSEKLYLFKIKTFDDKGNSSISITSGSKVYGSNYILNLKNRNITASKLDNEFLNIELESSSNSGGNLGTEILYQSTDGNEKTLFIIPKSNNLDILDFVSGSTVKYRSAYAFSPVSKDTVFTEYSTHKPLVVPKLQNAAVPFIAETTNGRWGTLGTPWITNDAAKNHGGLGGWDEWNGNIFNMESGWGEPSIVNGKVHQVITLDPANYKLIINIRDTNHNTNPDGAYFVASKGNTGIPNVENVEENSDPDNINLNDDIDTNDILVLGYTKIEVASGIVEVDFVVETTTEVSIGIVATQLGNNFCNVLSWELTGSN